MKKLIYPLLLCCFFVFSLRAEEKSETFNDYKFSGPYTYKNLTVYLINGKDKVTDRKFLTLQEAMETKLAVVHETEDVNMLQISNRSGNYDIFILAGDIVKGGKQDRVIQFTYVVPPKTNKMQIASFCVEQGRWAQRGKENAAGFHSSTNMIATKDLKMSVKKDKSQTGVWSKVSEMQGKLGDNLGASVRGEQSETSLQLTLENKKLEEAEKDYLKHLINITKDQADAVGYAFVINGKINSAEIFSAKSLFQKLWPKLIKASIVEAISDKTDNKNIKLPTAMDIKNFLVDSEKSRETSVKKVSKNVDVIEKESRENILFETRDSKNGKGWINKSYLKK